LGLSTFQPSRRILDWPSDVLALADHLSINTFHILAVSGGSPYALACAKNIPRSRLLNTAVVSGIYPLNLGTQGMLMQLRVLLFVASWLPSLAGTLLDWEIGTSARDADPKVLEDKFMKAMAGRPDKDVRCLDNEELRGQITESMRAAFVQGKQGAGMELKLLIDWGFGLEDVNGENLTLWHGGADVNTPFGMAENPAGLLKGCEFMTFEEETHMSLPYNRAEDILKRLLQLEG
jgi:pimeloyl-ACP methyl ester carboxylesterase